MLLGDRPVLFDCIEFDDDFACIDVLYDLAFLLMDLIEKGHRPAAARLLNGWLERTGDHAGLALLPAVPLPARRHPRQGPGPRRPARPRRRRRRAAPLSRARPPNSWPRRRPSSLAIGGGSGTGKTTLARALAPDLPGPAPGAVILRSDVIRKALFGRSPTDRLPPEAYAPDVSARVFATIAERAATCLAAGHSVIADAVYGHPAQRAAIAAVAAPSASLSAASGSRRPLPSLSTASPGAR